MKAGKYLILLSAIILLTGCGQGKEENTSLAEGNGTKLQEDTADGTEWEDAAGNGKEAAKSGDEMTEAGDEAEPETRELSVEELKRFTEFVNQTENNGFLLSEYTKPEEIKLSEVFYNGAGIQTAPLSEEERRAYCKAAGNIEIETDITRLTTEQIDSFLNDKAGIFLTDSENGLDWLYLPEYDSYIFQHGDTNFVPFVCTRGSQTGQDEYVLHCKADREYTSDTQLTLKKVNGSYLFVSNLYETNTDDTKRLRKIEDQSFPVELKDWGKVEFVSYGPDINNNPFEDVAFELQKDGNTLYTFEGSWADNVRISSSFVKIDGVAFQDYDKDDYTDVIIICTYEQADTGEQMKEARIYKGGAKSFRYRQDLSYQINAEGGNESIAQIMEKIELAPLDLSKLKEDTLRQLKLFMAARNQWLILRDYGPARCGYAVYDLDGDGRLELLTQVTEGTGIYSENHFYQVNPEGNGIIELPQEYYGENAEFDLGIGGSEQTAYKDPENDIIYYLASDVTKNGYAELYQTEGAFYCKNGRVYNMSYRSLFRQAAADDTWKESYYDKAGNEISKEDWERLYTDFGSGKEPVSCKLNWKYLYAEDSKDATEKELLRMLAESCM